MIQTYGNIMEVFVIYFENKIIINCKLVFNNYYLAVMYICTIGNNYQKSINDLFFSDLYT